jgi:hypothetical protein
LSEKITPNKTSAEEEEPSFKASFEPKPVKKEKVQKNKPEK